MRYLKIYLVDKKKEVLVNSDAIQSIYVSENSTSDRNYTIVFKNGEIFKECEVYSANGLFLKNPLKLLHLLNDKKKLEVEE